MMRTTALRYLLFLCATQITSVFAQSSNLPDVPSGVFEASTRIEIRSTMAAAWHALTDFPHYADWNPFVRSAIVRDDLNITLPEQYPVEGKRLFMRVQIPALPLPVNRHTPDKVLRTQFADELIAHVQPELGRLAWKYTPETLIQAQRWQAISDLGNGKILYESREVFNGALAETLKATMGEDLQKSFVAQGEGLKLLLEGNGRPH